MLLGKLWVKFAFQFIFLLHFFSVKTTALYCDSPFDRFIEPAQILNLFPRTQLNNLKRFILFLDVFSDNESIRRILFL